MLGGSKQLVPEGGSATSSPRARQLEHFVQAANTMIYEKGRAYPKDAGMEAVKRIQQNTVEKRLLNDRGLPDFYVSFYILDRQGRHAGVDLYSTFEGRPRKYAVCTENGPQLVDSEGLLGEGPPPPSKP